MRELSANRDAVGVKHAGACEYVLDSGYSNGDCSDAGGLSNGLTGWRGMQYCHGGAFDHAFAYSEFDSYSAAVLHMSAAN